MKTLLTLIVTFLPIQLFSQYQPIESTIKRDLIYLCNFDNNDLYYYNMNFFTYETSLLQNTIEVSGNLAYFNFISKTITKTPIYSKSDSINSIISIVQDNYDNIYTIRSLRNNPLDINPTFFLEKRTDDMSEIVESTLINISLNADRVINAFFDVNDILQLKVLQTNPNYQSDHYSIDNGIIINNFTTVLGLDNYYFHDINDSTYLSFLYTNQQIIYHKKNTFDITKTINLRNDGHFINEKSEILDNYLYLNGKISQGVWNEPSRHVVYRHQIESDTAIAIFIDSLSQQDAHYAFNSIDLIDSNYIYTGSNFGSCPIDPVDYSCISSFKIYSITAQGNLNWKKTIGGDTHNWLLHLFATPDSGCFVLYYRHAEIDSATYGNMYWIKYDKFGNEEPDYLTEFYLGAEDVKDKFENITLFPNPTNGSLNFKGLSKNKFYSIKIYNTLGKLVYENTIIDAKIDITNIVYGTYFYQINSENIIIQNGKLVKL